MLTRRGAAILAARVSRIHLDNKRRGHPHTPEPAPASPGLEAGAGDGLLGGRIPRFGEAGPVLPEGSSETWHVRGETLPGASPLSGYLASLAAAGAAHEDQ